MNREMKPRPLQGPPDLVKEFWSHSHEEVHVEIIVVGDEWLCGRTPCNHVHQRSLHLQEAEGVKELTHVSDDFGTGRKNANKRLS